MCFTFFFVLSVSKARSIFILLPASLGFWKPDFALFLTFLGLITYPHRECCSRIKVEKLIFSAFPGGMETLYTQCMLFGYCVGNPGLVKALFTTEPHPIKSDCNFTRKLVFS